MNTLSEDVERFVIVTHPQPSTCVITFDRPSKLNALSHTLIGQLVDAFVSAEADPSVNVIVLTGTRVFCAGADLKDISQLDAKKARSKQYLKNLCTTIENTQKPVIAAVESLVLGGGFEIALMCDMIVSSREAEFGFPEVDVGLIPGAGGTQRLTSIVGKYKAMKLILCGDRLPAIEAERLGLITQLVNAGNAVQEALGIATKLATKSLSICLLAKQAIRRQESVSMDLEFERSLYYSAFDTPDKKEGVAAFLEKRVPDWSVAL